MGEDNPVPKYNKKDFHPHGGNSNIHEAIRCTGCGRWITEDFRLKRRHGKPDYIAYKQVNFDADGGFFYISNQSHSPDRCKSRKEIRGTMKEIDRLDKQFPR